MPGLFLGQSVLSFGPIGMEGSAELPGLHHVSGKRVSALRIRVRQECPNRPGVYGMLNPNGELVYVGKAKSLRSRLLGYFRAKSRDPKAGRILQHTLSLVWEHAPSEFAALLRELELIRRWRPRFNVHGQPNRRRPVYVCVGRQPAPHVFLAPQPIAGAPAVFGPIRAGQRARESVRHLNDWFSLRDCPSAQQMIFAEDQELFPAQRTPGCLRYELDSCLGPCIAACTRIAYMKRVRAAQAFLAGTDPTLLDNLKRIMLEASTTTAFERAAAARDKLEMLTWLHDSLSRLRQVRRRQSFIYPVPGYAGADRWYFIHGGLVVAMIKPPRAEEERREAAGKIGKIYGQKVISTAAVPSQQVDGVFLVASWFRRHPEERARTMRPREALAACQQK
ncbi:MAG TPA: GIY-YIG nuclease family protein [Gemmataceae bacterium]|nr:GIY-YIG nuclease family protein [Gemmataceae bacterium]